MLAALLMPSTALAAVTVSNGNDSGPGSLRDTITAANSGETVVVPAGSYRVTSAEIAIAKNLTITGAGAGVTKITGASPNRILHISGATTSVSLTGVTLTGGAPSSAAPACDGELAGGAVCVDAGASLALARNTITRNSSQSGGGIAISGGHLTISGTTISANTAPDSGGGITVNSGAAVSITNSTITANTTDGPGGGVYEGSAVDVTITLSTVTDNHAGPTSLGGNLLGGMKVGGTIIARGSASPGNGNCWTKAPPTSVGFNLEDANQCGLKQGLGDLVNVDPKLGPLQDNGGPTQTMALLPGSPAINKGSSFGITIDQRGAQRPVRFPGIPTSVTAGADGADIGAYEANPGPRIVKVKYNKKKGTATVFLNVLAPGTLAAGDANDKTLRGAKKKSKLKLRRQSRSVQVGLVKLLIRPTGPAKKMLKRRHKLRAKVKFIYSATGILPTTFSKTLVLKLRH